MPTDDFSGVSVAFNAASYNQGATMTVNVTGQSQHTTDPTTTQENVTVTGTLQSSSGGTVTFNAAPAVVTHTTPGQTTSENVTITSVADSGNRTWTIASDGKSATATA